MDPEQAYCAETEKQIQVWSEGLDRIQTKADKSPHEVKKKCFEYIKQFREREPVALQHLDDLKAAPEDQREKVKHDVESAVGELKNAFEQASRIVSG